jgi:hypothetical protein
LDFESDKVTVIDYGTIPILGDSRKEAVTSTRYWLQDHCEEGMDIVLSEIVQMPGRPTSHKAVEIQGVCRLSATVGYNPSSTHSALGTKKKADARKFALEAIGHKLPGATDHVYDAAAVAMVHAIRQGIWYPKHVTPPAPKLSKARKPSVPDDLESLTGDEIVELMRQGKARVAK